MFHIYYFINTPFPKRDDSIYRAQNLEKLTMILEKLPNCREQTIELFYYRFSSGNSDQSVIRYFELFCRTRLRKPYILVFNSLSDLCVQPVNALRILRRWKERIDPDMKAYFTDYGFSVYDEIKEKLYDFYAIPRTGTRVNLADVFPYTLEAVERMRSDDSPMATLGQDIAVLDKYHCDYNRFISIKAVADYLQEEVRSLNLILKPSEGSDYSPRGIKIGQLKTLSAEQKNILKNAMEKDYKIACKAIDLKVMRQKYSLQSEEGKIYLKEFQRN